MLGQFCRLQQREGKKSTPPQAGLGRSPAKFRAEEMPEEELLGVQKMLRADLWTKELREEELLGPWSVQQAAWGTGSQNPQISVPRDAKGSEGSSSLSQPLLGFQHSQLSRLRSPGDNELCLAFSQRREQSPWPGWELPSFPGH